MSQLVHHLFYEVFLFFLVCSLYTIGCPLDISWCQYEKIYKKYCHPFPLVAFVLLHTCSSLNGTEHLPICHKWCLNSTKIRESNIFAKDSDNTLIVAVGEMIYFALYTKYCLFVAMSNIQQTSCWISIIPYWYKFSEFHTRSDQHQWGLALHAGQWYSTCNWAIWGEGR